MFAQHHLHHHHGASVAGSYKLPQWPPAGSIGSIAMSPALGHMGQLEHMFGTPPLGRSVDMVDMCAQLMEAGGERGEGGAEGGQQAVCQHGCSNVSFGIKHGSYNIVLTVQLDVAAAFAGCWPLSYGC